MEQAYVAALAAKRGTDLHEFAAMAIRLGQRMPSRKTTINMYVNDAISYRMVPEQILYYSENCYGHVDAIAFRRNKLRIHDLKTGRTATAVRQLEIYAAIFCLEYRVRPFDIEIELRIYQNNEVYIYHADPDVIVHLMDRIKMADRRIEEMKREAMS